MSIFHYNTRSRARSVGLELTNSGVSSWTSRKSKVRANQSEVVVLVEPQFSVGTVGDDETERSSKRAKLTDITAAVENIKYPSADTHPSNELVKKITDVPKKMVLTSQEHGMSGAPEGALYDVEILGDEDLTPCTEEEIHAILLAIENPETDVWAEQFALVTRLRRVLLHHRGQLGKEGELRASVFIVTCVQSLRSVTTRNALLCMRTFLQTAEMYSDSDCCISRVIQCLVRRCHNGPKFLTQVAEKIVPLVATRISPDIVIAACQDLILDKNPEVVKKAYLILCDIASRIDPSTDVLFLPLIRTLVKGINEKSADVRISCKETIKCIKKRVLNRDFEDFLSQFLEKETVAAVMREVTKTTGSAAVSAQSRLQLFRRDGHASAVKARALITNNNSTKAQKIEPVSQGFLEAVVSSSNQSTPQEGLK